MLLEFEVLVTLVVLFIGGLVLTFTGCVVFVTGGLVVLSVGEKSCDSAVL